MEFSANIAIHGTPFGFNYYGPDATSGYYKSFYNGNADKEKMVVEIIKTQGGPMSCYTFLLSENVSDSQGRPGGYMAISLMMSCYCRSVTKIYNILNTVCKVFCIGSLITARQSGFKHCVSRYGEASDTMDVIEHVVFKMLEDIYRLNPEEMIAVDGSFKCGRSLQERFNLNEITDDRICELVKQSGKIEVSTEFPTKAQAMIVSQLSQCKSMIEQLNADKKRTQSKLSESKNEIDRLSSRLASLQNNEVLGRLESNNRKLQRDVTLLKDELQHKNEREKALTQESEMLKQKIKACSSKTMEERMLYMIQKGSYSPVLSVDKRVINALVGISIGILILLVVIVCGVFRDHDTQQNVPLLPSSSEQPVNNPTSNEIYEEQEVVNEPVSVNIKPSDPVNDSKNKSVPDASVPAPAMTIGNKSNIRE